MPRQLTTTFTGLRFENPFLRDHALHHLQHPRDELGLCSQQHAQRDRQRQHPFRTGTCGMTWSTKCAAVCDIRRAPHGGQNPRRLQLKASSLSWPHSPQRSLRKSWVRMPRSRSWPRAAAPGGKAWSARGGGVRSGAGRHPAPAGAAGRWLARWTPVGVSPHSRKPRFAPQSLLGLPADVCPPLPGFLFRCLCTRSTGGFAATRSGQQMSLQGRQRQSALLLGVAESSPSCGWVRGRACPLPSFR